MEIKLSAVLLAIMSVLSYLVINSLNDSYSAVTHTHEVIEHVEEARRLLTATQSSARGYVIAENSEFLMPYNKYSSQVMPIIDKVQNLVHDNPWQFRKAEMLRLEASNKLNILRKTVNLADQENFEAARKQVASGEGERVMVKFRQLADEICNEERKLLVERQKNVNISYSYGFWGMPILVVLSTIILTIAHYRSPHI